MPAPRHTSYVAESAHAERRLRRGLLAKGPILPSENVDATHHQMPWPSLAELSDATAPDHNGIDEPQKLKIEWNNTNAKTVKQL